MGLGFSVYKNYSLPALLLGIFYKSMNKAGAIAGILAGLIFTFSYIVYFKFVSPQLTTAEHWLFGISPEDVGFNGMLLNIMCALGVSKITNPPPLEV